MVAGDVVPKNLVSPDGRNILIDLTGSGIVEAAEKAAKEEIGIRNSVERDLKKVESVTVMAYSEIEFDALKRMFSNGNYSVETNKISCYRSPRHVGEGFLEFQAYELTVRRRE